MRNILKSEFYKIKHTWLPWIHIILPCVYAITFYGAAKITGLKNLGDISIIQNYLVLLGGILPIVCGILTSKVVDMEVNAGHFQVLLSTTTSRYKAYSGKLFALLIGFLLSTSLAIIIFGLLFGHQKPIELLIELLLLFVGSLSIYMIHLWLSIILGGGASIGLGFVGTLIALLSMTNLGEKIWYFLPPTWPSRLSASYIVGSNLVDKSYLYHEIMMWSYVAIPTTIIIFTASLVWFSRWDGKSLSD
ncbi:lantibiotic immunity ABC transporter MutG family permease subunit [Streptococcus pacificus]|uniref:Lantibiotic immunity ABC transporter MutG family permease subunit n=1 Tax=Streptococcus pacificus TaxID=2740577 RepID=A0ABS0ZJR5_9STRE|nr:lantibiotic immunity ABC transporter MutG family permease subunit [Streptococcus pacificus]MBJ8326202.1 lantibiotic immunity ABC transporter MutG family permease subunit [Streptococcus pacificus]